MGGGSAMLGVVLGGQVCDLIAPFGYCRDRGLYGLRSTLGCYDLGCILVFYRRVWWFRVMLLFGWGWAWDGVVLGVGSSGCVVFGVLDFGCVCFCELFVVVCLICG